ncbi:MAG: hypothetical protein K9M54_13555 [Kiritimatiellales bacterium]|nr:hypothetical protein [Kiritimatiellales bacterium]MCF7863433.1 hypothetical protein [Kiritimatiellales bacterium]
MSVKLKIAAVSLLLSFPLSSMALDRLALLPADAETYVRISNTTNFWSKLKQSSIGKLWTDPQFQDFIGNPDAETWQEVLFNGESDAEDRVFADQLKMLKGEVILAFTKKMDQPCVIAAMSADDFARSLEMDVKLREVATEPFEIVKSTFQDVEIIQYIEKGGTPEEESSWQAYLNGTLVLGYTQEWVEKSIIQLKKDAVQEPKGNPELDLNIPLAQIISESFAQGGKKSQQAILDALGLTGIETYSLKLELKDAEMVADSNLRVTDLTKGLFAILDVQPSQLPTVTFIPENIASLEVGRFNLLRLWQEIPTALTTAIPAAKPQFDMILAMLQLQAGINFEQDLLANLGTKYVSFSVAEADKQISVIAVELKNGLSFKTGLETLLAAPALQPQVAASLEIETFLDHTLYTVKSADPSNAIAFVISGDYLLYGHPDGLRQVIRSQGSTAAANEAFERSPLVKGLRQNVSPKAFGFSAIDWKKNMAVIMRELSKPEHVALMQQNWAKSGSALPPPDFTKLPSADHIASFFNVSYQYAEATPNGLHQRIILKY